MPLKRYTITSYYSKQLISEGQNVSDSPKEVHELQAANGDC